MIAHLAVQFLRERRGDPRPYFLEVAPYAPHGRVDGHPAYDDESLFPAAFRDQPSRRHPRGNCGLVDCRDLTVRDLPGFGDRRADNRPRSADGRRARQWNPDPLGLTRAQAQNNLRDRARMAQSVDRLVLRILRMVDDNTYVVLTSDNGLHLGQLGLLRGKGTAYDTDTHVPLLVVGPGVRAGAARRDGQQHRLGADVRGPGRSGQPRLPLGHLDRADLHRPGRTACRTTCSSSTPSRRRRPAPTPTARSPAAASTSSRPTSPCAAARPCSSATTSTRAGTTRRYAYEFYDYTSQPWERTNQFDDPAYAAEVRTLMARLDQFDACASIRRDDPVPPECRQLTIEPPANASDGA